MIGDQIANQISLLEQPIVNDLVRMIEEHLAQLAENLGKEINADTDIHTLNNTLSIKVKRFAEEANRFIGKTKSSPLPCIEYFVGLADYPPLSAETGHIHLTVPSFVD